MPYTIGFLFYEKLFDCEILAYFIIIDICDDFVEIDYCGTLCVLVCFKCKNCGKLDWGNADLLCDKCK